MSKEEVIELSKQFRFAGKDIAFADFYLFDSKCKKEMMYSLLQLAEATSDDFFVFKIFSTYYKFKGVYLDAMQYRMILEEYNKFEFTSKGKDGKDFNERLELQA